jgi:hypothetical protein
VAEVEARGEPTERRRIRDSVTAKQFLPSMRFKALSSGPRKISSSRWSVFPEIEFDRVQRGIELFDRPRPDVRSHDGGVREKLRQCPVAGCSPS